MEVRRSAEAARKLVTGNFTNLRMPDTSSRGQDVGMLEGTMCGRPAAVPTLLVRALKNLIPALVFSAQRRGLDPHACVKDVLTRLPDVTSKDVLTALLPTH